jgi:hypothetical protein
MFTSCRRSSPSEPLQNQALTTPPSDTLPPQQLMSILGIYTLHYVEYDSVIVNGVSDSAFYPMNEIYLDTCHYKMIQYFGDNLNWNTTVYDVRKNIAWNYYNGQLTYMQLPNWPTAFVQSIQGALGSWLKGPITFLRTESVDGRLCNVFTDSTGLQEWIWPKYLLRIQNRSVGSQRGIYQIGYVRRRQIEVNISIPDTVFEPPI